ncbi:MAG: lytic transglycosylase domain-containing protein [Deltaproteobacteria bacterium]|nr:lytic transglycosylase domain-containing protein [Deltaproteobacteria bacterium]MBW2135638.1 lytic transglycosylase domain-containing protein [Deltaproteobacteria bacterium]
MQHEFPGRMWNQAACEHGVDPLLLYSVALLESNRRHGESKVRPHPYALHFNEAGISIYAASKREAKFVLDHVQTDNVDIGLGQVNYHHHKDKVQRPEDLLDPATNLKVASAILAEALASTSDLELGVGRYHSWTEWRARAYGRKVLAIYRSLKNFVRREADLDVCKERS